VHRYDYNIKMDLKEIVFEVWTRFIWLRIATNGGLLCMPLSSVKGVEFIG
jgi:hypothetical protein